MAIYLLCGILMLLGALLGRTDRGLDLAIWAYASAFVLSLMADLLRLLQAKLRAPWQGRKFFELVHFLALAAAAPLVYLSLFKMRPNYEIALAVCLFLWLTSYLGAFGAQNSKWRH